MVNLYVLTRGSLAAVGFPLTAWNFFMNITSTVPAPGKMVKTRNSTIHVVDSGSGPATIILEAGFSSASIDWCFVQPEIAKLARVISYDRGGYGWSRTKRQTRTVGDSLEELKEWLDLLEVKPPYILVGHSYGGMIMRLFASTYPNETKGLILVDAAHENQYIENASNKSRTKKFNLLAKFGYLTSWIGIPRLMKHRVGRKYLGPEHEKTLKYIGHTPEAYQTLYFEFRDTGKSAQQILKAEPLPADLPVTVISAYNPAKEWNENQERMVKLTQNTKQIKVAAGHSVHVEKPSIVIEEIVEMINRTAQIKKVE
ncbi:alpha/beta fold hydrolase [Rossellomorea vietnamensis]|uniref:alpha/beta fold hydrolase n=1 Tax=Rossellomorea vietnamensis TaxID=218284 RepID=UPI003CF57001